MLYKKAILGLAKRIFKITSSEGCVPLEFNGPAGLYIHIPFCADNCGFCPYNKIIYDRDLAARYPDAVEMEFQLQKLRSFESLYIGGGTPSLDLELLETVLSRLRESISGEIALELHPADATPGNLDRIKHMGVNFVSVGIQSFEDNTLRSMDRKRQDSEISKKAMREVMNCGFDFVDVDLIFDFQLNREKTLADFQTAMDYAPGQISVYPMMRFTGTSYSGTRHNPRLELEILEALKNKAAESGYTRDTLWTFRKKEATHRYSSVSREFFLGLGTSASSFNGREFRTNTFSLGEYFASLEIGRLPAKRVISMKRLTASLYYSFWSLYGGSLNLAKTDRLFGRYNPGLKTILAFAVLFGYLKKKDNRLVPTDKGFSELHEIEEGLTYEFIDRIWSELREDASRDSQSASSSAR